MEKLKLEGKSYSSSDFKIIEDIEIPDFELIDKMLKGEGYPIYVVRKAVNIDSINSIKNNFLIAINETLGGNRIKDEFVSVLQIGANQFHKKGKDFMRECDETRTNVNNLLNDLDQNALNNFMLETSLREFYIKKNVHFGPSYFNGSYCNLFTVRLWKDENEENLSLKAHEDLSQLKFAEKDNFEIHNVKNVLACNICVDNDSTTDLLLWNISPSENMKRKLNLQDTGYPYPLEMLKEIDCLRLNTQPGDIYFINANYLHAVEKSQNKSRITLGRFMGYISSDRVAYWT